MTRSLFICISLWEFKSLGLHFSFGRSRSYTGDLVNHRYILQRKEICYAEIEKERRMDRNKHTEQIELLPLRERIARSQKDQQPKQNHTDEKEEEEFVLSREEICALLAGMSEDISEPEAEESFLYTSQEQSDDTQPITLEERIEKSKRKFWDNI